VPGVVGNVGTLLGAEGINIAGLQLGRHERGGYAICLITVDNKLDDRVLKKLTTLPNIQSAVQIALEQ
ncbi:MAG: ACT domain-containing protein, partial [Desulfovibrio sp.]|nr:ACT domain-containing protein [Desulfovibrio sp.]